MLRRKTLLFTLFFLLIAQIAAAAPNVEFVPNRVYYSNHNTIAIEGEWRNHSDDYVAWVNTTAITVNVLIDGEWHRLGYTTYGPSYINLQSGQARAWRFTITGVDKLKFSHWHVNTRYKY